MINESLRSLATPIDDLHTLPGNPRRGDIAAVARSLERFGQRKPVVAQHADGTIIAGNHTWKAAQQLGWRDIAAVAYDCDDETALRILIADNRATDLATYNDNELRAILEELANTDAGLDGTLFDQDDLQHLIEKDTPLPEIKDDTPPITCPNCGEQITTATPR